MSSHQGQGQGQGDQGQATRQLRNESNPHTRRLRHQLLATLEALDSDADASSDLSLSEVDQLPESESGFSEFETPLAGRWDMAAHWGDYSEGVEGDADDDDGDDEERDIDTDLSEGPRRSIHLDLGRIQEILSSSPSSTPIVITATSTSPPHSSSHDSLLGPLLASSTTTIANSNTREQVSSSSGLSTNGESWLHRNAPRPFTPFMDMASTPVLSPEPFLASRQEEVHTDSYHGDMEDSQGESHQEVTRGETSVTTERQQDRDMSPSILRSTFGRSDSARARALVRPSPPLLSREERRHIMSAAAGGIGGIGGIGGVGVGGGGGSGGSASGEGRSITHSLSRERERRLISRPGFWTSPRTHQLSPYWTALARQLPRVTASSISSRSPSPVSSASSSRTASPVIDNRLASFSKPPEDESVSQMDHQGPQGDGDTTTDSQHHHRRMVSTSIASLPLFVSSAFSPHPSLGVHGVGSMVEGVAHRPTKRNYRRPCCFLQPGQKFHGTQNLKSHTSNLVGQRTGQLEEWDVKVTISAVDYNAATVFGLMEAMDVPMSESNVVTFWEGEIIDFENHNFWTKKWAAKAKTDLEHWKRLEAFQGVEERYIIRGAKNGKFVGHISQKYIFMRWKEKHFVNSSEHTSGLTIAGFYYIAMRRSDGAIEGYYHDQQSTPFQHLCLQPTFESRGFSSAIFEVA